MTIASNDVGPIKSRKIFGGVAVAIACSIVAAGIVVIEGMTNEVWQTAIAPGGKYVATLAYYNRITFGYEYLTLYPNDLQHRLLDTGPASHDEVGEMADEGIDCVAWLSAHTLLVKFDPITPADQFVLRKQTWRGVRILGQPSLPPSKQAACAKE